MNEQFAAIGAEVVKRNSHVQLRVRNEPESIHLLTQGIDRYQREVLYLPANPALTQRNIEDLVWYTLLKAGYLPDVSRPITFDQPTTHRPHLDWWLTFDVVVASTRIQPLINYLRGVAR